MSLSRRDLKVNCDHNFFYFARNSKLYREYQYNIVKGCLHTNTLVCLPTGLGKTLIASTIMYNFYQWFNGKIFFFAPTKPLVNQQMNSFNKLFPELSDHIVEMNGLISRKRRDQMYRDNTFFFLTPQTLDNDLTNHLLNCESISLLIFDEAHKAQKQYAYATIVQKVFEQSPNNHFRIIGLSASPGSNIEAIQNVINSLKIKRIEFRNERDEDIVPYVFKKKIIIEEIEMSADINKIQCLLEKLIQQRLDVLLKFNIISKMIQPKYLTIAQLLKMQKEFKERKDDIEQDIGHCMIGEIYQTFSLMFQVMHCKKKLVSEGIESFKEGIKKIDISKQQEPTALSISSSKRKINCITPGKPFKKKFITPYSTAKKNLIESIEFQEIKQELHRYETTLTSSNNKQYHPKLVKLKEILLSQKDSLLNGSKIIIFADYKDSTVEIRNYLIEIKELNQIGVEVFTGQGKNFKQKDQLEIMRKFREGEISVIIATSVAEEGLDIGEVDLIICYDFNTTSPIKMIQRFGRTGRKRNGIVIVLASKGEEKTKYYRALRRIKSLYSNLKEISEDNHGLNKIALWEQNDNILIIPHSFLEKAEDIPLVEDKEIGIEDEITDSEQEDEENNEDESMPQTATIHKNRSNIQIPNSNQGKTSKKATFGLPNIANSQTKNQHDISKWFIKPLSTPKLAPSTNANSKVVLSFKIMPQKTDSGNKFKTSSCKRPSLKPIPELVLDNSIQECSMKIDTPLHIDQSELDKIIEEIETDNKKESIQPTIYTRVSKENIHPNLTDNNQITSNPFKANISPNNNTVMNRISNSNNKVTNSNNISNDFITEEMLNEIFNDLVKEENQADNALKPTMNLNHENIENNTINRISYEKRKYSDYIQTKFDL